MIGKITTQKYLWGIEREEAEEALAMSTPHVEGGSISESLRVGNLGIEAREDSLFSCRRCFEAHRIQSYLTAQKTTFEIDNVRTEAFS